MKHTSGIQMVDTTRAEFGASVSVDDLHKLSKQPQLEVLQCSKPIKERVWSLVNEHFCAARPDVELRVYGHYSNKCDLSFARLLTNIRHFAADCLRNASNVEAIAEIPELELLSLGIFELKDFSVLERISPGLKTLRLSASRSKRLSLALLKRFKSLRVLYLEGHSKNIEVLSDLPELEDVTLRSVTTPNLHYLANLPKLWSLDMKLGGTTNFKGIEGKNSIKYFELWQVRGLRDIDIIGKLPGLQNLFLQSLPHVELFPRLTQLTSLRRIVIENLKGLCDFTALETAPALEEFALIQGNKQTPQQLMPVLNNPRIRRVSAYFGSDRKNNEFLNLQKQCGKAEWDLSEPFVYDRPVDCSN